MSRGRASRLLGLGLLAAVACGGGGQPGGPQRDARLVVWLQPEQRPERAAVVGDFNGWEPGVHPLRDADGDGLYRAVLQPPPGRHLYRLWVDGQTRLDAYNPLTLFDAAGREHSVVAVPGPDAPDWRVDRLQATADGRLSAELTFLRAPRGAALDPGSVTVRLDGGAVDGVERAGPARIRIERDGLAAGKHRLEIEGADRAGRDCPPLRLPFWIEAAPHDWRDGVIYQVLVDRFRSRDGPLAADAGIAAFHGGDLYGVAAAVESGYFAELGVDALWLSPVYAQPQGAFIGRDGHPAEAYHGYWPAAPRAVDERFGGAAGLEHLVATAHAHGLRVILDAVLNHVHAEHPYAEAQLGQGWFNHPAGDCICGVSCSWAGHMQQCWFDPFLPDLRWRSPAVVDQLVADALWWLERFDLDGLRIDAVPMMPRLAVRQLRHRLQRTLERAGGHVYLLGETYTRRGGQAAIRHALGPHSLSGQFDYPVMWALRDALCGRDDLRGLAAEVEASRAAWAGSGAVMAPMLGNHDVPRLISDLAGAPLDRPRDLPPAAPERDRPYALQALAWTFLLSQPGAPVIYYGDEIGMPGAGDPDNRRAMRFAAALSDRERGLLHHVRRLGRARRCSRALRRGGYQTLFAIANLYAYGRPSADGRPALVVLNPTTGRRAVDLAIPPDWPLAEGAVFADLFGAPVSRDGRHLQLTVPALSAALLLSEPACIGGSR